MCVCGYLWKHEGIDGWAAMSQKRIKALCSVAEILFTGNVCTDTGRGMTDLFFPRLDLTGRGMEGEKEVKVHTWCESASRLDSGRSVRLMR